MLGTGTGGGRRDALQLLWLTVGTGCKGTGLKWEKSLFRINILHQFKNPALLSSFIPVICTPFLLLNLLYCFPTSLYYCVHFKPIFTLLYALLFLIFSLSLSLSVSPSFSHCESLPSQDPLLCSGNASGSTNWHRKYHWITTDAYSGKQLFQLKIVYIQIEIPSSTISRSNHSICLQATGVFVVV